MKVLLALAFLVAGISALSIPHHFPLKEKENEGNVNLSVSVIFSSNDERIVSGQVEKAIEEASQAIKDTGYDPFLIEKESSSYELPVPSIFNYDAAIENILSTGLSNIKTNDVDYHVISSRLSLDVELPLIDLSVESANANAEIFSNKLVFSGSGKIEVARLRVKAEVRVNIGIISGISLRSLDIDFTLEGVNSNARVIFKDEDVSDDFNDFFGVFVPTTIKEHYDEINELLEIVLTDVIEANL